MPTINPHEPTTRPAIPATALIAILFGGLSLLSFTACAYYHWSTRNAESIELKAKEEEKEKEEDREEVWWKWRCAGDGKTEGKVDVEGKGVSGEV